ncbi:alpha/beta hydrolase [Pedobacter sp. MR2016-19]|uniref:alpha/beta hydrolase n=1 Tax=Pedobacter sp. MR2016-19 TaxID=2780089 RepID=UPI0018755DBC|nr:alpha/beta hydrolase [Pedobacter sp. MR2016-19]MBE5320053.1 alpha/beta hydrolase [Pedobacter sp. MR2016-19]
MKNICFVLLYGGSLNPEIWQGVIDKMKCPAFAAERIPPGIDLKKLTILACARYVSAQIEELPAKKIILAGHSMGGLLIPQITQMLPDRIVHQVYIGSPIPKNGKNSLSTFKFSDRLNFYFGLLLEKLNVKIDPKHMEQYVKKKMCNDLDTAMTAKVISCIHPEPPILLEKINFSATPKRSATYIRLLKDKGTLSPEKQSEIASYLNAEVISIESGHTVMLSQPESLALAFDDIASKYLDS